VTGARRHQLGRLLLGVLVAGVGLLWLSLVLLLPLVYVFLDGTNLPIVVAAMAGNALLGTLALAAGTAIIGVDRADGVWPWVRRRRVGAGLAVVVVGLTAGLLGSWFFRVDWGTPTRRVASPTGEFEVVQYEWTAVIDPAWNLAVERVEGDGREWFWRSVEGPGPATITFVAPTTIEVVDEYGGRFLVDFDPTTLEPSERYCLRPEYCYSRPWDGYTRESP
jgi:hypothetical protein